MKPNLKAALLSAFLLPGIGQLSTGRRLKGGIMLALANIFVLAALFLVLRGIGPAIVEAKLSGTLDAVALSEKLTSHAPAAKVLLALFAGLWCYGIIDALFDRGAGSDHEDGC